jgi:hypothetical protein
MSLGDTSSYVCVDCDIQVYAYGLDVCPVPPRCASCLFLADHVADAGERAELRAHLTGLHNSPPETMPDHGET